MVRTYPSFFFFFLKTMNTLRRKDLKKSSYSFKFCLWRLRFCSTFEYFWLVFSCSHSYLFDLYKRIFSWTGAKNFQKWYRYFFNRLLRFQLILDEWNILCNLSEKSLQGKPKFRYSVYGAWFPAANLLLCYEF